MTLLGHFVAGVLEGAPVWLVNKATGAHMETTWLAYRHMSTEDAAKMYALPSQLEALEKVNEILMARLAGRSS